MPRLRQVGRADSDHPLVQASYDVVFGEGADPADGAVTETGSTGDWWTVFALVPDVLEHAVNGFMLYRSWARTLPPVLRELGQCRAGWSSGSTFVYSQHCKALRGLGVDEERIAAVPGWAVSTLFDPLERAVLAYTDSIVLDRGRVDDAVFDALRAGLSDEQILELTYVTSMYTMHATIARALRLESDDVAEPVAELASPDDFDPQAFVRAGTDRATTDRTATD